MIIKINLLDLGTRRFPIEFSIPRYVENHDLYVFLKPYWASQFSDDADEYGTNGGTLGSYLIESNELVFSIRMLNRLCRILHPIGIQLDTSELLNLYGPSEIDLSTPFINDENFLLGELYENQYDGVKKCCSKFGSVFEAGTGFGKNTVITYLISHYKGSGNILVLGPRYSILTEIKARANEYEIPISDNPDCRAVYIHPSGFLNSNNSKDPTWIDWLNNVDMILIDECESITDSIETLLRDYCKNYRYIYGFSATADKYQGRRLDEILGSTSFLGVRPDTYSILYYVGCTGFYVPDNHHFDIYTNYVHGLRHEYWKWYPKYDDDGNCINEGESFNSRYSRAEDQVIRSPQYIDYLKYITMMATGVVLAPVKNIAQCDYIWTELHKRDPTIPICYWTGQYSCYYDGNGDINNYIELDGYNQVKELVDNRQCKVLICTSVGYRGVDFIPVNDVLLCIGTKNGIINQVSGRLTRNETDNLRVWLLANANDKDKPFWDEDAEIQTPILDSAVNSRKKYLREHHSVRFIDMIDTEAIGPNRLSIGGTK